MFIFVHSLILFTNSLKSCNKETWKIPESSQVLITLSVENLDTSQIIN